MLLLCCIVFYICHVKICLSREFSEFDYQMMSNNNNLGNEIGLVTEFLNIWSDFEKFSNRKEMCKSQVIGSLTESTDVRFSKRLKCLDSRDLGENLYIDYVGSYTVKKSTKEGSSRYRQPR